MRYLIFILALIADHWILSLFLPWWNLAIVAFLAALLLIDKVLPSILVAFLSFFAMWFILIMVKDGSSHILGNKLAEMLKLNSHILVYTIAALMAGLVGGFAAGAGSALRSIILPKTK